MTNSATLQACIKDLVQPGKGILAADESLPTIAKRFAAIGLESTEQTRRDYRVLLAQTDELERYISGVILFEGTLSDTTDNGETIPSLLQGRGIVPGVKVDKGTLGITPSSKHKVTQGLDGLAERLAIYRDQGALFAKWRNVYRVDDQDPDYQVSVSMGAEILARYAAVCQQQALVPIVEPEVLMDGAHDIKQCAAVTLEVQHAVFQALYRHNVDLRYIVLKPNMVLPGEDAQKAPPNQVAEATLDVLTQTVPVAVPSINFLSGGQAELEATANLQAINQAASSSSTPWLLSFSYGRALQAPVLKAWQGHATKTAAAQAELQHRAAMNSAAVAGCYSADDDR
jgi:fructose-bisphosphate aldolase, class I